MIATTVLGASGFAGQETLDRVLAHPQLELIALGSDSLAGEPAEALDPRLGRNGHGALPGFISNHEALAAGAELVFCCLDGQAHYFVIPFGEIRGKTVVEITRHDPRDITSRWLRYYEAWDILTDLIRAGRNAWQPQLSV